MQYAVEPWSRIASVIMPLWQKHYEEIALDQDKIPLDPDWDKYDNLADLGILRVITARDHGRLVGYIFLLVSPHLHYKSTLCGLTDIYWLDKSFRRGWNGVKLFTFAEEYLRSCGVVKMFCGMKLHKDNGKLFEYLGWKPVETGFSKWIGG